MPLPRIYCPEEISAGRTFQLPAAASHHAVRVLRLKRGDQLILFNGKGGEFSATIDRIERNATVIEVREHLLIERESPLVITLAQAVCAGEKMDWIIQKGVELGVSGIQVLATKLSTTKLLGERAERRATHWRQVAISACEQCGRNHVPQVFPLAPLRDWLGTQMSEQKNSPGATARNLRFILSPSSKKGLGYFTEPLPVSSVTLLVGPEGGLSADEEVAAAVAGFVPLGLGPRILRTETAGLAAIAAIQARWGDL